jgi:excisionase family DNA binding protein
MERFSKDFEASLAGLETEEQLVITGTLRKVIPILVKRDEGYYETFYEIFEKEILEKLRDKAQAIYNIKLTDYFDQESSKHELKINNEEQYLSDEEYENFIEKVLTLINLRHQILLISKPKKEIGSNQQMYHQKPKAEKITDGSNTTIEEELDGQEVEKFGDREEYMSIAQCAKFLGCSKVTIHEYKKQGLPFYRIGRTVKFKKSEVLNFMRQHDRKNKKRK